MADMTDYDRIMRQKREATSARFGTLPPELQPSPDAEDPLKGAGFGELTPEQEKQLEEEQKAKSALYGQRPIDKMIEGADRLSLVDPTPTMDTISTGLQLGRGVIDDASSSELGQIASIGLAGALVPFIPGKAIRAMKSVPADHPLRVEGRQVINDVQRRVDAGELTDAQGIKEMNEKLEVLVQNIGVERTLEKGEKAFLAKVKRSKRSDAQLKKAGTKERDRSDQRRAEAAGKAQRLTSEIDRDLYGKGSVGEFAGGQGTFVSGGRARELDEAKRLRGSRKDPAQEYGSGPTAEGARKVMRKGRTEYVRPGAQRELEQLKKAHRAKPRRERGPEPTAADVPNFYMTKQQFEEFTTQSTNKRAANLERRRKQRTQRRIAESAAQKEAAQQAAKPTQYNEIEMDYLRSLPAESYDAARKQLDAAKAGGMVVTRNKKGEFGFKSVEDKRDFSDRRRTGPTRRGQPQAPAKDLPRLKKKPTADDELKAQTVSRLDKLIADADKAGLAGGESNVIVERLRNTKARLERGALSPSDVAKRLDKLEKRAPNQVKKKLSKPLTVEQLTEGGKFELYVGSPKSFTEFRPSSSGQVGSGVYLSADREAARGFSLKTGRSYLGEGSRSQTGNLMTVEVDIKNPITLSSLTESQKKDWARALKKHGRTKELGMLDSDTATSFDVYNSLLGIVGPGMRASAADAAKAKQIAQDAGYDSVVTASKSGTPPEVVVFNPENIKIKSTEKTRSKVEAVDKGPQVRGSESDDVF